MEVTNVDTQSKAPAVVARGLSFSYASEAKEAPVIGPFDFTIEEGAFCLLTGLTGCGKTTILLSMKPELSPQGRYGGTLDVCGVRLIDDGVQTHVLDSARSAECIGFVMQDPDSQIVCDTVWHEIAFGLENVGCPPDNMRRRVAEVCHYFGIAPWVDKRTDALSGGQKQLLNLAAVLALRPRLILLDEPTAQLDPSAKRQFGAMISRVQRELGVTVVMATHMPEDMADYATQTIEISPIGKPAPLRRLHSGETPAPGVGALSGAGASAARDAQGDGGHRAQNGVAVSVRDVFVRHAPDAPWVLKGLDLNIQAGTVHAIVGGNGSGKTTLLRTLAGDMRPRRGKVDNRCRSAQVLLPQDPKAVFVCDTIDEELREWQARVGYSDDKVRDAKERFGISGMDDRHPYDLSGGQRQCLAFAKMWLCDPALMLLDEPTKGLDARACARIVCELRRMADEGMAVVLSTHDLDVAAACADTATLIFDGQAVCTQEVPAFFEDNLIWRPHETARLYGELP